MRRRRERSVTALACAALVIALVIALGGCGVTRGDDSRDLLMIIPNSPGGGYDQTGRAAVKVMDEADITGGSFTVDNVVGAGGAGAMTSLIGADGDEHTMMTVGLGVVGSTYSFATKYQLQDATPLAQLMSEPEGILVPGDSPFETVDDLVQAWADDPGGIAVGGGSSPGGPDHLFPMQLADTLGIDPNDVNYITYDGGGPLTSALLGEKIDVGFSGPRGVRRPGRVRVSSGCSRSPARSATPTACSPTCRRSTESDIDLVFLNWRGVLAPPGISDERTEELIGFLEEMHDSRGLAGQVLADNGWTDDFVTGDEFGEFIDEQDERVSGTLEELGLHVSDATRQAHRSQGIDRAQYGLAAVLAAGRALHDRRRPRPDRRLRRPGRAAGVPVPDRHRDGRARGPAGGRHRCAATSPRPRTVRTSTSPRRPTGSTVGKLVGILVLNLLLVNVLGWAITGHAALRRRRVGARQPHARARPDRRRRARGRQLVRLLRAGRPAHPGDPGRDPLMDTLDLLLDGLRERAHPREPAVRRDRRAARHLRRRAAGHRPGDGGGAAPADHLRPRRHPVDDHVRRHLLRRDVRRLDDLDPAQHPG